MAVFSLAFHAIIAGGLGLMTFFPAKAETVIFSHQGSIYRSGVVANESGLFCYEALRSSEGGAFLPGRRVGDAWKGVMPAFCEGKLRWVAAGGEYDFDPQRGLGKKRALTLPVDVAEGSIWTMTDYNGDGRGDVVVFSRGSSAGQARIFYGRSDGSFAEPFVFQVDGKDFDTESVRSPFFVNLDDDDDLDFLHLNAKGQVVYYENRNTNSEPLYGAGRILSFEGEKEAAVTGLLALCPTDRNADGRMDWLVVRSDGAIGVLLHRGVDREGMPEFSAMEVLVASPGSSR